LADRLWIAIPFLDDDLEAIQPNAIHRGLLHAALCTLKLALVAYVRD